MNGYLKLSVYEDRDLHNTFISLIISLTSTLITPAEASNNPTIYQSHKEKSANIAENYNKSTQSLARYLAYRDIPSLIKKYALGKSALDYGSGAGFSTRFLLDQGFETTGVDISSEMLSQARSYCPLTNFHLVENGIIPFDSPTFDLIFSSFVLFEIGSEKDILKYLREAKRVMKRDSVFIGLTASKEFYTGNLLILNTDFPENKNLKSGDMAKVFMPDANMEFTDYFWTESDYIRFFEEAGFTILEIHRPLGKSNEPYLWKDEKTNSPFLIFIAKPN